LAEASVPAQATSLIRTERGPTAVGRGLGCAEGGVGVEVGVGLGVDVHVAEGVATTAVVGVGVGYQMAFGWRGVPGIGFPAAS